MKIIERKIEEFQNDHFFFPIRTKIDFAKLLLNSTRQLLIGEPIDKEEKNLCLFKLIVDKMSRLFFYTTDKFFSISFPFNVLLQDDELIEITTYSGEPVDNQSISSAISVLNDPQFQLKPSPMGFLFQNDGAEMLGLNLLEEIFMFEPAYVRYDHDPQNQNGNLHPLHHLDVNYSSYGTYKLGLNNAIIVTHFEDILNISTDCRFLH